MRETLFQSTKIIFRSTVELYNILMFLKINFNLYRKVDTNIVFYTVLEVHQ